MELPHEYPITMQQGEAGELPPMDPNDKLRVAVGEVSSQNILKELEFQIPLE